MTSTTARRWPTLSVLLSSHLPFVGILWVLFTVVTLVITGVVAATSGVSASVLHHATTQAPRWLLFGLGIDAVLTYLRMHLAHGRTRREFAGQAVAYAVAVAGVSAALLTAGYLLERGVYALFGWPQTVAPVGLFGASDQYPAIFGAFWLSLLLWTVAGLVIGLGFFRSTGVGLLMIPVGVVIALPSFLALGYTGMPFFSAQIAGLELGVGTILAASAVLLVLGVGVLLAALREVPMRAQPA